MIKLIIFSFLFSGIAGAMNEDPLTRPLPKFSAKPCLAPIQRTGMAVIGGLIPTSKEAKPSKKVAFNMGNLAQKLIERDLVSPDVTAVYNRDKSDVGFLGTGDELIESIVKYGQIKKLRAAKPGTQLQILRSSMTDGMGAGSSPRAFSGVIFRPKAKTRSTVRTEKVSAVSAYVSTYRPRILSNISSETAVSDEGQLPIKDLMRTADIPSDSDKDE